MSARFLTTAAFVLLLAHAATAAEFHVAPTGNDANPGTQAKPFATLERAREVYTLGRQTGSVLRGNIIHDVNDCVYGGWGIYNDQGSAEFLIEKNIVFDTNDESYFQNNDSERNVLRNNILMTTRLITFTALLLAPVAASHAADPPLELRTQYDIVAGAGTGGCGAAIQAARMSTATAWAVLPQPSESRIAELLFSMIRNGWNQHSKR